MKLYFSVICLFALIWAVASVPLSEPETSTETQDSKTPLSFLNGAKAEEMDDLQIAKMYIAGGGHKNSNSGDIVYPKANQTWHVGQKAKVVFRKADYGANETVSIFFFDKTPVLAGGPISNRVFTFKVPASAYSGRNATSLLLAVKRKNFYLQSVDSVVLHVI
ncbi:hypothetical protein RMATCC62417_01272 [Rhizopus microsporus]|nr:hypothetical protein RMATCC62417_01272 [Rhizopus microsporus]